MTPKRRRLSSQHIACVVWLSFRCPLSLRLVKAQIEAGDQGMRRNRKACLLVDFVSCAIDLRFRKSRLAGRKLYFRIINLESQEACDAVEAQRRKTTHQEGGYFEKATPVVGRGGLSTIQRSFRGLGDPSSQFSHRQGNN
jgi:hypothetical protein